MIRFACPSCRKALSAPDEKAGLKLPCPGCGQRLQIPVPFAARTVLGELLPAGASARPSPDPLWFYLHQGKQRGPVAKCALQKLSSLGRLGRDDLVWRQGMKSWAPFSAVPELLPDPAPAGSPQTPARTHPANRRHAWVLPALLGAGLTALALCVGGLVVALVLWPRGEPSTPPPIASAPVAKEEPPPREPTTAEVVARSKPSVALVRTTTGSGTGFLAGAGLLVTNAHVIDGEVVGRVRIYFPSAKEKKGPLPARLVYEDPKRDLAVLAVDTSAKPLPVAEDFPFEGGEKVVVIGNPGATAGERIILENAVTLGVMSTRTKLDGLEFYQLSAAVNPGNSGGPVLNARGEVIGVVTRKAVGRREEGLGFAVPLPDLKLALKRAREQDPREVARRAVLHDFRVVFRRLAASSRVHAEALVSLSGRLKEAVEQGESTQETWDQGRQAVNLDLLRADQLYQSGVKPFVPGLVGDENLPEAPRKDLGGLAATHDRMHQLLDEPQSVTRFINRSDELLRDRDRHLRGLRNFADEEGGP